MKKVQISPLVRPKIEQLFKERQMIEVRISEVLQLIANSVGVEVSPGDPLEVSPDYETLSVGFKEDSKLDPLKKDTKDKKE